MDKLKIQKYAGNISKKKEIKNFNFALAIKIA